MILIYILAYSLQITGAIVLLLNSFGSTALAMQRAISEQGKGGVLSGKNIDQLDISKDLKEIYLNRAAFGCLIIGYFMGVFGESGEIPRLLLAVLITVVSAALTKGIYWGCGYLAKNRQTIYKERYKEAGSTDLKAKMPTRKEYWKETIGFDIEYELLVYKYVTDEISAGELKRVEKDHRYATYKEWEKHIHDKTKQLSEAQRYEFENFVGNLTESRKLSGHTGLLFSVGLCITILLNLLIQPVMAMLYGSYTMNLDTMVTSALICIILIAVLMAAILYYMNKDSKRQKFLEKLAKLIRE